MEYSDSSSLSQEDMNRFALLPDELLLETCESMNNRTLVRFTKAYKRAANVCRKILSKRKSLHDQKIIDTITDNIITSTGEQYISGGNFDTITIKSVDWSGKNF